LARENLVLAHEISRHITLQLVW